MTEHAAPAWCGEFLGKPFARGAAGPAAYDCYGIVRAGLRRRFEIEIPALDDVHLEDLARRHARAVEAPDSPWYPIDRNDAREGDVLEMDITELHVGLVVSGAFMLHSRPSSGVQLARWRRDPWFPAIVGAFRHRELRP